MRSTFELLFVSFCFCISPVVSSPGPPVTWVKFQHSAVVKIDTPGYPLWLMDKANAPMLHKDAGDYYWAQDKPSALLLNITMTEDRKTLLLNHQAILPFADSSTPPQIEAYQVPADITAQQIKGVISNGLLNRAWEGLTLSWRFLALDYDRIVWADPATGPYQNHEPTLSFRIMGIGAHSRSDVLDAEQQKVLQITLTDSNHGSSDSPDRSYGITKIALKNRENAYKFVPFTEGRTKDCSLRSWRCPDAGLYQEGAPWYRFIWRERFDQYGRIGSLRHAVYRKADILKEILNDAGPAMLMSFAILMGSALVIMAAVAWFKRSKGRARSRTIRDLAEDDRLLGGNERYFDDEDEKETPPPLPPRPKPEEN